MLTFMITIVPSLLLILYFFLSDRFKEPKKLTFQIFILGVLSTIPAFYLNNFIIKNFETGEKFNDALLTGFFAGGLIEEILKFSILYFFVLKKHEFNEPMDGIVYGVAASLGFASLENLHYVYFRSSELGVEEIHLAILRAFTAVPLHGLVGCVTGFYFGLLAFTGNYQFLGYALVVPVIFHGTYNFLLSYNFFYAFLILIILLIFVIKLHNIVKTQQRYKKIESEKKKFI
jgi:RsiW-degrading membrane proteinase PrsW (M82 family)